MLPDITIQALVGLFKHLYHIQSIPFEWDSKLHIMKIPKSRWKIWLWYVNLVFSVFFTVGITFRFWTNVLQRNFDLTEIIVCFYISMYELLYTAFLLNSWIYWERIPNFINQWLLFNRNSTMVSIMLEDDSASEDEDMDEQPEIPPEADTDSTDNVIEVQSNKSAYVRRAWKKTVKRVYKTRNRKDLYAEEMEKLNLFIIIRKLISKKIKFKQVLEPAVLINVMKNSVLSDSIFFALLMARLDKMALVPDKPFWFEVLSGVWVAYQAYTTWNNAIFYLFVAVLFAHDANGWLTYCSHNTKLILTTAATKRKYDLSLRIYKIIQTLNTQFNFCFRIFIMLGHEVVIGACQVAALYGTFRLFGKINAFSYLMLPLSVSVTLGVESIAYKLFAANATLSMSFKKSWQNCTVLESHQMKSLATCRTLRVKVWSLYSYQRNAILQLMSVILSQNIVLMLI